MDKPREYVTLEEYLAILEAAVTESYRTGLWHPEDMMYAIESANVAASATLRKLMVLRRT
jgi:hypothetical protein